MELGGSRGSRGGLPAGCQLLLLLLLLLLLDEELLLRLHWLRRLLQELGGLQRGVGCGDSDGGQGPPLVTGTSARTDPTPTILPQAARLLFTLASVHSGAY